MKRVLILHGYSSENRGDGLLVDEAVGFIREAVGDDVKMTLCASYPSTFAYLSGVELVNSGVSWRGYNLRYLNVLRSIKSYDLVVGVGGGYLRAGYPMELVKTALVHGPQLLAAAVGGKKSVYMPQSIGPLRYGSGGIANTALKRLRTVMVRDDRSHAERRGVSTVRMPDIATLSVGSLDHAVDVESVPVLSVRAIRGSVPGQVHALARRLKTFDGYIQSTSSGNNDVDAMESLHPREILEYEALFAADGKTRVVVAVRLHAALMALQAGHFVVHLAYERKGFGAFADLGLEEYVHNVNSFDIQKVMQQIVSLSTDARTRKEYAECVESSGEYRSSSRDTVIRNLRDVFVSN